MTSALRHRPLSHPVLLRNPELVAPSLADLADMDTHIEALAIHVSQLPDTPLTVGQKRWMRCILRELDRRVGW